MDSTDALLPWIWDGDEFLVEISVAFSGFARPMDRIILIWFVLMAFAVRSTLVTSIWMLSTVSMTPMTSALRASPRSPSRLRISVALLRRGFRLPGAPLSIVDRDHRCSETLRGLYLESLHGKGASSVNT